MDSLEISMSLLPVSNTTYTNRQRMNNQINLDEQVEFTGIDCGGVPTVFTD